MSVLLNSSDLRLYEELMLLALRDEKGTPQTGYLAYGLAGAILVELLQNECIALSTNRKQLVEVLDSSSTRDELMDGYLQTIAIAKRPYGLQHWVSKIAGDRALYRDVARQLCRRGILHTEEQAILFIFKREVYPERNALPEQAIMKRLQEAIFSDRENVDLQTVLLLSMIDGLQLSRALFGKEVKSRKKRIASLISGEKVGKATRAMIDACQAATVAASMAVITASTINS
jgi:Golgi phosphoprotein 3